MQEVLEIEYLGVEENQQYNSLLKNVVEVCFQTEKLDRNKTYVNIILTTPVEIQRINNIYRNIDKPTDVLSFPMFEKEEIKDFLKSKHCNIKEVLGDIVVSVEKVKEQAKEYGHSEKRELAFLAVHGLLHLLGYDHMEKEDEKVMFSRQELILDGYGITK